MLTILIWILALLLALLLLLVSALLFLPVDLYGRSDSDLRYDEFGDELDGSIRWRVKIGWGWRLLRVELAGQWLTAEQAQVSILGHRLGGHSRRSADAERKPKPRHRSRTSLPVIRAYIEEGARVARRLWQDLGWRVEGDLTYGFGDPALMGCCEAALWATGRPLPLTIRPDWLDPRLEGWVQVQGRIYGVQFLVALLATLKNPVLRRHWLQGVKAKFRGRKTPIGGRTA